MKKSKILALILSCAMLVSLAACGSSDYGTAGGKAINADLFDAFATNAMYSYTANGYTVDSLREMLAEKDEEGVTGNDAIKEYTLETVLQYIGIEKMAEEHNISLTADEKKSLEDDKAAMIEQQGGRAKFVESLKTSGLTEETFDYLQTINALQSKLFSATFNKGGVHEVPEDEIISDMTGNCVRVVHILIQAQENSADFAEKKAKAEATLARAKAGEDFTALINEVNEDPGMTSQPNGYVFDKQGYTLDSSGGQMVTEFTEASWALQVGQVSDLVKSSHGFHIIKRLPLDTAFVTENMDTYYPYYAGMQFSMELAQVVAGLEIETNEAYDAIDMANYIPKETNNTTTAPAAAQ